GFCVWLFLCCGMCGVLCCWACWVWWCCCCCLWSCGLVCLWLLWGVWVCWFWWLGGLCCVGFCWLCVGCCGVGVWGCFRRGGRCVGLALVGWVSVACGCGGFGWVYFCLLWVFGVLGGGSRGASGLS
ncbi:hypothetical protein RA265_27900, partial [Pseudomonas syringae pv. tagetis]|uniref:hypothetical protein n=1 Tax=Pseudomonas syringae group genomosp. 7 TaxID=251699 RepID=UPI00376F81C1